MFDPQLFDLVKARRASDLVQATTGHAHQLTLQNANLSKSRDLRTQIQRQIGAIRIWIGRYRITADKTLVDPVTVPTPTQPECSSCA